MSNEHPHNTNGEPSPLPGAPTSPSLSSTFRHPAPNDPSESSLRHRTPYAHPDGPHDGAQRSNFNPALSAGHVRISIQTPFGDLGGSRSRRKEGWPLPLTKTVSSIKEDLISGRLEGAGTWEKEGMRIVYHGRIIRDQETLQEIIGKVDPDQVYVLHLVARRIPVTPLPTSGIIHQNLSEFPLPPQTSTNSTISFLPTPTTPTMSAVASTSNSLALADTMHYLLFTSRYHLFSLLGMTPLKWDEMMPKPLMTQSSAREAIMSVVRVFAEDRQSREEGWENWQDAFVGDDEIDLKKVWDDLKREGTEREIKSLWATATGRNMAEGNESVQVQIDQNTYTLQLPALTNMTANQLCHLLVYLRITALLPLLEPLYQQSLIPTIALPTPTPTQPATIQAALGPDQIRDRNGRVVYRRTFHLRIPFIPISAVPHLFWSAVKISAMIWMLTRGMRWNDSRFWVMAGLAFGWYCFDALNEIGRITREIRNRQRQNAPPQAQAQAQGQGQEQNANQGAQPAMPNQPQAQAQNVNVPQAPVQGQRQSQDRPRRRVPIQSLIPRIHIVEDCAQLRLPPPNLNGDNSLPPPPRSRSSRLVTQFLLPVLLWFITLVPEWESIRARAIRRRERRMRVVIGERQTQIQNQNQAQARAQAQAEAEAHNEATAEGGSIEQSNNNVHNDEELSEEERIRRIEEALPEGISQAARKYYLRVVQSGEGIDWEEEREAQRALGVGDEDEQRGEDDGMRLRML
ncbi:uncharacterized protein I303_103453 [Kwoniella dejecticola CBS 10117]|uniref:Ubiquitin-like domain-containing protein n=1 Tax=Kwoniella dejecticola CBS 10117 TaxID=1296121 RepID=A0A1A6A6S7_9TREE|nr:uncharacterized protein I303_03476 [Kwoniella dejecticola CBS 10117]OBR85764.1 hypothetical protein I303_03476 [Kwoniella dejecticola CBS 10117]